MSQLSTAADFFNRTKRRFKTVCGFGLTFRIRSLTEREKSQYQAIPFTDKGFSRVRAQGQRKRLLVLCVVDESGEPVFSEADADRFDEVDGGLTDWLYGECRTHCWPEGVDAVESAEKNSVGAGGSGSPSGSPSSSDGPTST